MNKNRTESSESTTTRNVEARVRGFFERASDRIRNAVRNVRGSRDPSRRFESNLPPGYGYEPQRWREGSVHEPMLEWREDRGYEGRGQEGRRYERDEDYRRGRG